MPKQKRKGEKVELESFSGSSQTRQNKKKNDPINTENDMPHSYFVIN